VVAVVNKEILQFLMGIPAGLRNGDLYTTTANVLWTIYRSTCIRWQVFSKDIRCSSYFFRKSRPLL